MGTDVAYGSALRAGRPGAKLCLPSGLDAVARLERPVISIGNLTVGGTGKTPSCIWLAGELERRGIRAAILTRGHKRRATAPVILRPSTDGLELFGCGGIGRR